MLIDWCYTPRFANQSKQIALNLSRALVFKASEEQISEVALSKHIFGQLANQPCCSFLFASMPGGALLFVSMPWGAPREGQGRHGAMGGE